MEYPKDSSKTPHNNLPKILPKPISSNRNFYISPALKSFEQPNYEHVKFYQYPLPPRQNPIPPNYFTPGDSFNVSGFDQDFPNFNQRFTDFDTGRDSIELRSLEMYQRENSVEPLNTEQQEKENLNPEKSVSSNISIKLALSYNSFILKLN